MNKILISIAILLFFSESLTAQIKTLKDSLLEMYTIEELKAMTSRERGNAVRLLRGLEPLPPLPKEREFDEYGVKIIKNIPVDSVQEVINARVGQINREKATYHQEVFPNAHADVVDGYGLSFYKSFIDDRTVDSVDRNYIMKRIGAHGEESPFSNFSRRIYYSNSQGQLRLITREIGYNINEGKQYQSDIPWPLIYIYEELYVWNDTLQYHFEINAEQNVNGPYPDYWTQEDVDGTPVSCEAYFTSHYKNNCFNYYKKQSEAPLESWRSTFDEIAFDKQAGCANGQFINLRNLILERVEYSSGENDYLQPVPTSFLKPFVVEGR